jgi:hypothetical protein
MKFTPLFHPYSIVVAHSRAQRLVALSFIFGLSMLCFTLMSETRQGEKARPAKNDPNEYF